MIHDLRHAIRGLLRTPGFTAAAVLTLALGIGANVAVFTMAYSAIAKPLPFPDAERLVWIGNDDVKNGTKPAAGRLFRSDEDVPGSASVVVLSHALWQRRFGGGANIVGRAITLKERSYTVTGVLPAGFAFTGTLLPGKNLDVYVPLIRDPKTENLGGYLSVIGRLRPGVTPEQAEAQLAARQQALARVRPFMSVFRQPVVP